MKELITNLVYPSADEREYRDSVCGVIAMVGGWVILAWWVFV
jgi:hypothetical protein